MLNRLTLEQNVPLAQKLASQEKHLGALEGTPLAECLSACSTHGLYVETQSLADTTLDGVISYLMDRTAMVDSQGTNQHTTIMDNYVDLAAKSVSASLIFARNTVLPDVKDVLTKVQQTVAGMQKATIEPYIVEGDITPALFSSPQLMELVDRYSETPARAVSSKGVLELSVEQVMALLTTGAPQFDAELKEAMDSERDASYVNLAEVLRGNLNYEFLRGAELIAMHVLSKRLFNDPPEGALVGLTDYNDVISQLTEQTGRQVYGAIQSIGRREKLGLLYNGGVTYQVTGPGIIKVNNSVYLALQEQGLRPEHLVANEILERQFTEGQLIGNLEYLQRIYDREMRLRQLQANIETAATTKEAINRIFAAEIATREEDDLPVARGSLQDRLNERVLGITGDELACLPLLVRDMVCHVFYAHTDAQMILSIMDRIGNDFKDAQIDPREVALLATIEYVSIWVAKQIKAV